MKPLIKEQQLFCVGKQFLYSYDLNKLKISFFSKQIKKRDIVSCIDLPNPRALNEDLVYGIVAFGKFDKEVCLLSKEDDKIFGKLKVHVDGITSIKFSPTDSIFLFTAARKDDLVYQWDLRKYDKFLTYFERRCATNQRMNFDVSSDGKEILLGNEEGTMIAYNIESKAPTKFFKAHQQCCNTVKFYDFNETTTQYCLSSGGQRTFYNENELQQVQENNTEDGFSLKFWKLENL